MSVCVVALGITEKTERMCIKFCQNLGETCIETYYMIKMAFGEDSMSYTEVFEWFCYLNVCGRRRQVRSKTKLLLTVFFLPDAVVYYEFAP